MDAIDLSLCYEFPEGKSWDKNGASFWGFSFTQRLAGKYTLNVYVLKLLCFKKIDYNGTEMSLKLFAIFFIVIHMHFKT